MFVSVHHVRNFRETYSRALAQLERRMMSQIDLTKLESDWVGDGLGLFGAFLGACHESGFRDQVDDEADEQVLVGRLAFGHQQGQGGQGGVPNATDHVFLVQVQEKEQGRDALVAVRKRMILDDEIQQVRGFELATGVQRLAEHGLFDVAENGG